MDANDIKAELLQLERAGWDSLIDSTGAEFYGRVMTDDGVMILIGGFVMGRDDVVKSLGQSPAWAGYELHDVRVVALGDDAATLVYRATATRDDYELNAWMSSTYRRVGDEWRLAVYQQTGVEAAEGSRET